jgi:ribosomal protein S20
LLRWPSLRHFQAIAAQPAKTMTERGMIEKVNAARKEFALKGGRLKWPATFEWNASTRFAENGKPAAASELKTGERAVVNYASHGNQRVATRIAISPSGKTAQRGVIEKVNPPRKQFAHNWLDS